MDGKSIVPDNQSFLFLKSLNDPIVALCLDTFVYDNSLMEENSRISIKIVDRQANLSIDQIPFQILEIEPLNTTRQIIEKVLLLCNYDKASYDATEALLYFYEYGKSSGMLTLVRVLEHDIPLWETVKDFQRNYFVLEIGHGSLDDSLKNKNREHTKGSRATSICSTISIDSTDPMSYYFMTNEEECQPSAANQDQDYSASTGIFTKVNNGPMKHNGNFPASESHFARLMEELRAENASLKESKLNLEKELSSYQLLMTEYSSKIREFEEHVSELNIKLSEKSDKIFKLQQQYRLFLQNPLLSELDKEINKEDRLDMIKSESVSPQSRDTIEETEIGSEEFSVAVEKQKAVKFEAISLLLDFAVNGELDQIKNSVGKGLTLPNSCNSEGVTALHCASFKGHGEIVKYLIEKGANANAQDEDDWTPLHCAAAGSHKTIIEILLEKGANFDLRNIDNERPVDLTEDSNIIELLKGENRMNLDSERAKNESEKVVAIYDFDPVFMEERDGNELGFSEGQELSILNREDPEWWYATANGKEGFIPSSYVI